MSQFTRGTEAKKNWTLKFYHFYRVKVRVNQCQNIRFNLSHFLEIREIFSADLAMEIIKLEMASRTEGRGFKAGSRGKPA